MAAQRTRDEGITTRLAVRLFSELNQRRLRYIHFKSNLDLQRGLRGETDLDLLVERDHRSAFGEVAAGLGFKRTITRGPIRTEDVDHFFGLDSSSGSLIHLHVYYELLVGGRTIKDYDLGVTDWLFQDSRVVDEVRIPSIETELFLLYIRANLKVRVSSLARSLAERRPLYPAGELKEFRWLREQSDPDVLQARIQASGLGIAPGLVADHLTKVGAGDLSPLGLLRERRRVRRALRDRRRGSLPDRLIHRAKIRARSARLVRKLRPLPKKVLPDRGRYVAVVGADGSGKTTLVRDLTRWLGWKFDVRQLYFGIPKGSLPVWSLRKARGAAARLARGKSDASSLWRFFDRRLWLYVARRRLALHREATRTVDGGAVVFAERFPLPQLWDMSQPMDGPRIPSSPGAGQRRAHERERKAYEAIGDPDLILVLDADLETLRSRERNLRLDIHEEKVRVVGSLRKHPKAHVIDARGPYDEVLLEAKQAVWRNF